MESEFQKISFDDCPLYVYEVPNSKKALIVVSEWWGITPHMLRMTKRYSTALNCTAVAIDFYRGKVASNFDEANHLYNNLDFKQAVKDIGITCKYLRSKNVQNVGAVGFCMGGALVVAAAVMLPEGVLTSGSAFYGTPPAELCDRKQIKCPVQFHFGDLDKSSISSKEVADKYKQELIENGKDVSEFHQYADGNHAWMNEDAPHYPFNESLAAKTFSSSVEFFKKTLA